MTKRIRIAFALLSAVTLVGACDDSDDRTDNPSFSSGGEQAGGGSSNDAGTSSGAGEPAGGGSMLSAAGADTQGGVPNGAAGAPAAPPYDCVLAPKTHLDIINACTDALRIEKHPELPPIE